MINSPSGATGLAVLLGLDEKAKASAGSTMTLLAIWLLLACCPVTLNAAEWTGDGENDRWSSSENWSGNATPRPDAEGSESLTFAMPKKQTNSNDLGSGFFRSIRFLGGGFTLQGPSIIGVTEKIVSVGNNTITADLELGGGAVIFIEAPADSAGTLSIDGSINLRGLVLHDNTFGRTIANGSLTGAGELRVFSFGEFVLAGDNSDYDGIISVYRSLRVAGDRALGGKNTTVRIDGSFDQAFIDLDGRSVADVSLHFTLAAINERNRAGALRNTADREASFGGDITLDAPGRFDGDGDLLIAGRIKGPAGFEKAGSGILRISGGNAFAAAETANTAAGTFRPKVSVREGTLLIGNTDGSATGGADVEIEEDGAFGGNGGISGGVRILGGVVSPGDGGPGSLGIGGDLVWQSGRSWPWDIATADGGDRLIVSRHFIKEGNKPVTFDFGNSVPIGRHVLISFAGLRGFADSDFRALGIPAGCKARFELTQRELALVVD